MPQAGPTDAAGGRLGRFVRDSQYLRKWLIVAVIVGVIAGFGAVVFFWALRTTNALLLGGLGGYRVPTPLAEGGDPGSARYPRAWVIPLVAAAGALVSSTIMARIAPEAAGLGTDNAIRAVHTGPRTIRGRAVAAKIVASSLTIGSGGSAGREGPTAQVSAGFGSWVARRLDLSDADGRTAIGLGIGAGIGAIFGAPLGGTVLAASIVYRDDFESRWLAPGFIASATAHAVCGSALGFEPMFGFVDAEYRFQTAWPLGWFVVLGVAAAAAGYAYARVFRWVTAINARLGGARALKAALGGALVGLLGLAVPQVLGTGYGWAQLATGRESLAAIPLWIVLVLPAAKIAATALTIGTGGSGGVFGPGIVIGAFVGAALWRCGDLLGLAGVPDEPGIFVVVGMMACFGSVAHASLAVLIMVAEMTGSFSVVPGAIIAVGVASLLMARSEVTIYRAQHVDRRTADADRQRRHGADEPQ